MNNTNRLDKELYLRKAVKSRTAASYLIVDGKVTVNGRVCKKPSREVGGDDVIEIVGGQLEYVSRGGLKLEHALKHFMVELDGTVCLDVGASTGGFTDCMLKYGAKRVYAVDVGTGQLSSVLKEDQRVVSMERCDIRKVELPEKVDFFTVDVSFISVKLILPGLKACGNGVVLIKPQFELGKKHKGVIADRKIGDKIAAEIAEFAGGVGFKVNGVIESPITGGSGNREFLMGVSV